MITVRLPDGSSIRVNTDDPAAASRAAKSYLSKQSGAAPEEPPAPSMPAPAPVSTPAPVQTAASMAAPAEPYGPPMPQGPLDGPKRDAQLELQGMGNAAAHVLGLPADLGVMGMNIGSWLAEKAYNAFQDRPEDKLTIPTVRGEDIPGTSESIQNLAADAYRATGQETIPYDQMTPEEKLKSNIIDYGGQAVIASPSLAARAVERVGAEIPKWGDRFLRPYMDDAAKTIVGDVAGGAGAGAGVTAADEYTPDNPWTKLVAMFFGGHVGSKAGQVASAPKAAVESLLSPRQADVPYDPNLPLVKIPGRIQDKAARVMQEAAGPEDQKKIADVMKEFTDLGLPTPTTGTATDNLELLGIEKALRTKSPNEFIRKDEAAKTAAADKIASVRPEVDETGLRAPQRYAQEKADTMTARARGAEEMAAQRLEEAQIGAREATRAQEDLAAPLAAVGANKARTQAEASKALDETLVSDTLNPRTKAKNEKFDVAAAEGGTRDVKPLADLVNKLNSDLGALTPDSAGVPAEFVNKLKAISPKMTSVESGVLDETGGALTKEVNAGGSGKLELKDLQDVRKYLSPAIQGARRKGNYELADNLSKFKTGINDEIDKLAAEGGPGSAAAREAQTYYKQEYAPYFAQGFGKNFRDEIQRQGADRTALPASKVGDWWLGGSAPDEKVKDLKRIIDIAPDPAKGEAAVRNYLTADMAGVVHNGTVNPKALSAWISNNGPILDQFPKFKEEVTALQKAAVNGRTKADSLAQDVENFQRELRAASGNKADVERAINNSALGIFIKNSPENAVREVLGSADPEKAMDGVLKLINDAPADMRKDLNDAWKASVTDSLLNKVKTTALTTEGKETISYAMLVREMRKHDGLLAKVYSPEEMQSLQSARKVLEPLGKLSIRAGRGSNTPEDLAGQKETMKKLEAGIRLYYGALEGGSVFKKVKIVADQFFGGADDPHVARLVERAMVDPKVANLLFNRNVKAIGTPKWNAQLQNALRAGAVARENIDVDKTKKEK